MTVESVLFSRVSLRTPADFRSAIWASVELAAVTAVLRIAAAVTSSNEKDLRSVSSGLEVPEEFPSNMGELSREAFRTATEAGRSSSDFVVMPNAGGGTASLFAGTLFFDATGFGGGDVLEVSAVATRGFASPVSFTGLGAGRGGGGGLRWEGAGEGEFPVRTCTEAGRSSSEATGSSGFDGGGGTRSTRSSVSCAGFFAAMAVGAGAMFFVDAAATEGVLLGARAGADGKVDSGAPSSVVLSFFSSSLGEEEMCGAVWGGERALFFDAPVT